MTRKEIGTYGYQSRKNGSLDEAYGFETVEEALEHSMAFDKEWHTIIMKAVDAQTFELVRVYSEEVLV